MRQVRPHDPGRVIAPASESARGLSGGLRRLAYAIPEHKARHWMLLVVADRVDVLEHRLSARPASALAALGALVGAVIVARAMRAR